MRKAKISLVQFESIPYQVLNNIEKAIDFMNKAAKEGSDLIVFPELFNTGYIPKRFSNNFFDLAEDIEDQTIRVLSKEAVKLNINVVAPIAIKSDMPGIIYNSAVVINRKGECQGTYNKTHVWADERNYFKEGSEFPTFKLDIGTIGIVICYDGGFPEASRSLTLKGAELILCPAAFPMHDKDLWDIYFKSRSLENTCFVAGINRVGHDDGRHMFGNNQLFNPRGKELLYGEIDKEDMQTIEIDFDDVSEYRKQVPFLRDLRPEIYHK